MADDPLRASLATKGERRAALLARLAGDGEEVPPAPVEPDHEPPAPAPPVVTQGARTGVPGPAPPSVDDWIRDIAGSRRRGGGGVWTMP
jgi:hypothetical protein